MDAPTPSNAPVPPAPKWADIAGGINSIVNASHIMLILITALVGFAWHVEATLNRHDIQLQQMASDHAEDRRGIAQLSTDIEQVKLQMATRQDIKDLADEIRKGKL